MSPPKARRFFVEILNGTRRSFIFLHTYACHCIIPHFVDGDSLTSTAWHRGITGHLGLEVADGLEHGCHFSPLLDSHRHADLVAGRTLHATLLLQVPGPHGVSFDDARGLRVDVDPILK